MFIELEVGNTVWLFATASQSNASPLVALAKAAEMKLDVFIELESSTKHRARRSIPVECIAIVALAKAAGGKLGVSSS